MAGDGALEENVRFWTILFTVTVWVAVVESQFESPARVAVIPQLTPPVAELSEVPDTVHCPLVTVNVTEPVPLPPLVARVRTPPVVKLELFVNESVLWVALATVIVVSDELRTR